MASATDTASEIVVEAVGLTKVFHDFWHRPKAKAVNGVDLTIRRGQVFGLLGPNGSGKSTTVKMLLGLLYPTRGSLTVLGSSPSSVETKRRIGYLPEESYLYRYLTAAETLDFFGSLFGLPPEERRRRCVQLLEMVGLGTSGNRQVGEFSKGMARRVGIAQALINDPDLVILDEPTSGLDPIGCREVKDIIQLLAKRGKTIILCSHLLADVEDVCDEVVIMYGGRVQARGKLSELLTIGEKTRIVAPKLEPAVVERVLAVLNDAAGAGNVTVDQPSMDLESFFLDVVRKAQKSGNETAGARAEGKVADYLQTPGGPENLLDALRDDQPKSAPAADSAKPAHPPVPQVDTAKLAALSGVNGADTAPSAKPATPATPPPKPQTDIRAANEKLKSLIGE